MSATAVLRSIGDFCFPPVCKVCDEPADAAPLCAACLEKLRRLELSAACARCALPIAEHGAPCPHCAGRGLRPFEHVLRLGAFADPIRPIIHALKFHRAWGLGEFLADRAYAQPAVAELLASCDVIVPVPLHPLRQVERGYNQAEVIAGRLARLSRRPMARCAVRLVHTAAQTDVKSRAERVANLRRAFGLIDARAVHARRVVLVDDVRTTAATLRAFGRCLKRAAPASLDAVVIAATDPRHADFEKV